MLVGHVLMFWGSRSGLTQSVMKNNVVNSPKIQHTCVNICKADGLQGPAICITNYIGQSTAEFALLI